MRTMQGSSLELMLLGLLGEGARSGYDLRKVLTQSPMRAFSDSPGAIYPALRRLQARKWVDARSTGGGRGRQELRLNKRGQQALREWLQQPVTRDDVVLRGGDLLLRCAFMDFVLPPSAIRRFLARYLAEMQAYLEVLRGYDAEHGPKMPPLARRVFQHGLAGYELSVAWARDARAALSNESTRTGTQRRRR